MKIGTISKVFLDDSTSDQVYKVIVTTQSEGTTARVDAFPLNTNVKVIPIVGESVLLLNGLSPTANATALGDRRHYYLHPTSLQNNVNHNAIPNINAKAQINDQDQSISSVESGIPNVSNSTRKNTLGNGFTEVNVGPLQPFLGDVLLEGRFGQSIRFGHTPKGTNKDTREVTSVSETPNWSSPIEESPITIIRNGGTTVGYNKFVIEDVNSDDSSIWMGSKQTIGLQSSHPFTLGTTPQSSYSNPQIVINSDRIVLNSKTDSVLISGNKSVNVSTPNWKADMDVIFTQLEAITDALIQLAPALTGATAGPVPIATLTAAGPQIASAAAQIKTQLTLMKQ